MPTPHIAPPTLLSSLLLCSLAACSSAPDPTPKPDPIDMGKSDMKLTPDMTPLEDAAPDLVSEDMAQDTLDMGAPCPLPPTPTPGVVSTQYGPIQGAAQGGQWTFLGVPFAAPPTGQLRFSPPAPHPCWGPEPKDTASLGPPCPQLERGQAIGDEDCLRLNIWTKQGYSATTKRPVMVFIHGGGNIVGSSVETLPGGKLIYDGQRVVDAHDVVMVSIQYRLGPLGFLALPQLSAESMSKTSGHYAPLDQIAALQWIKDNILGFGGDPDNVMIFGESAGALNICTLLASPLASGLFQRALMQSGGCVSTPLADAEQEGLRALAATPCKDSPSPLQCLRALDTKTLIEAIPVSLSLSGAQSSGRSFSYGPVVDGHVLKDEPLNVIKRGEHNKVPFIIGSNADEMASENIFPIKVSSAQEYENTIRLALATLPADTTTRVLAAYPVEDYPSPQDAIIQVFTDSTFTCPARRIARHVSANQTEPVYRYFFSRRATTAMGETPARHGIELLYVFGSLNNILGYRPAATDKTLSEQMMASWASLATTGSPSTSALMTTWSAYNSATDNQLVFDANVRMEEQVRKDKCDLWDDISGQN